MAKKKKSKNGPHYVIWGTQGWVAFHLRGHLHKQKANVHTTEVPMHCREAVLAELNRLRPTHVFIAAGYNIRGGKHHHDFHCSDKDVNAIRANVIGVLTLADACFSKGIHCTVFATGEIYNYDDAHPVDGPGFKEEDKANLASPHPSTEMKHWVDGLLTNFNNCLILRMRMAVSDDLNEKSFLRKMTQFERIVDIPNSYSILHDVLPAAVVLAEHNTTGVYNLVNPGVIHHKDVLKLFYNIVYPGEGIKVFRVPQEADLVKVGRSNCVLDTTKLVEKLKECDYEIPDIYNAWVNCFERMSRRGFTMTFRYLGRQS